MANNQKGVRVIYKSKNGPSELLIEADIYSGPFSLFHSSSFAPVLSLQESEMPEITALNQRLGK
jgi:hypothetical protein